MSNVKCSNNVHQKADLDFAQNRVVDQLARISALVTREWNRRERKALTKSPAMIAVAFAITILSVFCIMGVSLVWPVFLTLSAAGGFAFCHMLLNQSEFCEFFQSRLSVYCSFYGLLPFATIPETTKQASGKQNEPKNVTSTKSPSYRTPPWASLFISKQINDDLEDFLDMLIENYINNWYKTDISADSSFLLEVRHQIRHAASVVLKRLNEMDVVQLVLDELLPQVVVHVERVGRMAKPNTTERLANVPPLAVEARVLSRLHSHDLHWALETKENERDYLRVLADALIAHCVDATQIGGRPVDADLRFLLGKDAGSNFRRWWPSHSCRHFLRELLLYSVLMPFVDFITDPDMLNRFVLNALSGVEDNMEDDFESGSVEFLSHLTEICQKQSPDSLLGVKLNDLVREPRLIQLFDMYLRDIQGPTHLLDCFLQARDIHQRIQRFRKNLQTNSSNNKSCEGVRSEEIDDVKQTQKMALSEIESDAWQLFSAFIHESAPNRIEFSAGVRLEFATAISVSKSAALLEKVTEEVYKEIYQKLHFDYVIPFCQSENYLGYMCGAPPDVEELIRPRNLARSTENDARGNGAINQRPNTPSTFSLAQFRNKLFSVIGGNAATKSGNLDSARTLSDDGVSTAKSPNDTDDLETGEIALVDLGRDLNKWSITIPSVEIRQELVSSKTYFVYVIEVRRNDLNSNGTQNLEDYRNSNRMGRLSRNEKTRSLPYSSKYAASTSSILSKGTSLGGCSENQRATAPYGGASTEALVSAPMALKADTLASVDLARQVPPLFAVYYDDNGDEDNNSDEEVVYEKEDDMEEMLPITWTTCRKYDEFFFLEEKIREFHGNSLRATNLPDRKAFSTTRNRSLMEAHRLLFERFLQTLAQQTILKRSDLLYDFLTLSEDEWTAMDAELVASMGSNSFIPDLRNPFRAMRRMPTKLARERGQNLKPFILNVLANILLPRSAVYSSTNATVRGSSFSPSTTNSLATSSVALGILVDDDECDSRSEKKAVSQKSVSNSSLLQLSNFPASSNCASASSQCQSMTSLQETRNIASPSLISSMDELHYGTSTSGECVNCFHRINKQQMAQPAKLLRQPQPNDDATSFDEVRISSTTAKNVEAAFYCNCRQTTSKNSSRVSEADETATQIISCYSTLDHYFQSTGLCGLLTFITLRILRVSRWIDAVLVSMLRLFQPLVESLFYRAARHFWNKEILRERNILSVLRSMHKVVFEASNLSPTERVHFASDEERRLRADLTLHRLEEAVSLQMPAIASIFARLSAQFSTSSNSDSETDLRATLHNIFTTFQLPRLNRQLAFVLIDKLASHFLNETEDEHQERGSVDNIAAHYGNNDAQLAR